ncbi:MAG: major capsid protein [Gammaproteobacteria bacterium]|nr:major capsid protein [Gammaproteobacteria bacterium]
MDNYADFFVRDQLLVSLAKAQYIPRQLGASGTFESIGLTGTHIAIEEVAENGVAESSAIPRGGVPHVVKLDKNSVKTFTTSSHAWTATVQADEVLNARATGTSGAAEILMNRIDRATAKLRRQADFQHEYLRVACLNSPSNVFGSAPAAAVIAFGSNDSGIRAAIHNHIVLPMEAALGGLDYTGIDAWCSNAYWAAFIESKTVRETYLGYAKAAELLNRPADDFEYGGVTWHRYRASGNIAIEAGTAKMVPRGVVGLFLQCFAPDDTTDSVGRGALGEPYYINSMPLITPAGIKGYQLALQTHPLMLCTRPAAILTVDLS